MSQAGIGPAAVTAVSSRPHKIRTAVRTSSALMLFGAGGQTRLNGGQANEASIDAKRAAPHSRAGFGSVALAGAAFVDGHETDVEVGPP